ncbi:MAG: aminotransferase class I/II-fold pyridoxal phosphate-dependent enzyme [Synergistaceae bacterium]
MTHFRLHGANPEKLYRNFNIPITKEILDFSTNTNALPWEGKITVDITKTLCDYPDDEASEIKKLLAEKNHCQENNILVTSGANEPIYIIASYQGTTKNSILSPVYGEYERALQSYGVTPSHITGLDNLTSEKETIWICNPCNPTGQFIEDAKMEKLFTTHKEKTFIIDEAYSEFMYDTKCNIEYTKHQNVLVLRSLTKIYHLCGARIGYVLAQEKTIEKLKKRQPTWSVNSLAQQAALTFLKDKDFPVSTREYYRNEVPRLIKEIENIGYEVQPTTVNYFLVKIENDEDFIIKMLYKGIVVRHTRNFIGLNGKYVRIAARTQAENNILIKAMAEYKNEHISN